MAVLFSAKLMAQPEARVPELLIDDFSSDISALGTPWEGFTDRVMGGRSDMVVGIKHEDGHPYLSMTGNVSLANNGGFIQARLLLKGDGRSSFDASRYSGIRLSAKGRGDDYYILNSRQSYNEVRGSSLIPKAAKISFWNFDTSVRAFFLPKVICFSFLSSDSISGI